jgi:hypothetical protein
LFAEHLQGEVLAPVAHRHVVFTVPKALRGMLERERRLLGLVSRCAYESVRRTWVEGFGDRRAVPGMVASIQTFGSYANFHPHIHAVVSDGVMTREGTFLPLPRWTPEVVEEVFRRLVVSRLVKAERLSEEFAEALLGWERSGFSVYGEQVVLWEEEECLERLLRYVTRAPMAYGVVEETEEGKVRVRTPVDPRTGERDVVLDPVEWIHAVGRQVPDPRQHVVRYYGAYANRSRRQWQGRMGMAGWGDPAAPRPPSEEPASRAGSRTGSWARLLRRILEVDPLWCPRCGVEMRVVSVITEPTVVDEILGHLRRRGDRDPFAERGPPAATAVRMD